MSKQPKEFYKKQSAQYIFNDLMPKAREKREMNQFLAQIFTNSFKLKQKNNIKNRLPTIIEPTNLTYQLVPGYVEMVSPRYKMVDFVLKHQSAIPAIVKDVKKIPIPPKVPTYQMLQIFHQQKRSKITNVKSAVPINFVSPGLYTTQPPPAPSQELIRIMYEEKRERLTNIRSAIPLGIIDASKRLKPPQGKIPNAQTLSNFQLEKRQKLSNIKPAIPLQLLKSMNKMQKPSSSIKPPDPDAIKDFLYDKKQRISNVKQAVPQYLVVSRPKAEVPTKEKLETFLFEKKHKITNVRNAIKLNDDSQVTPPLKAGPSHEQIKSYFFEKNERLSNIRSAIPYVLLNPKIKPPEGQFNQQKLNSFQQDRKMRIDNVISALPQIFIQNAPAPPQISQQILKQHQFQMRHSIQNVKSAVPSIQSGNSVLVLPQAPNDDLLKVFFLQERSKITNVRPAISQIQTNYSKMPLPPPLSHNTISQFFEEKKFKISNVRSAINSQEQIALAHYPERSKNYGIQFKAPQPVAPPPIKLFQDYISQKNLLKYQHFRGMGTKSLSRASLGMMSYAPSQGMQQPHDFVHHPSVLSQDQASWIDDFSQIDADKQDYRDVIQEASDVAEEFSKTELTLTNDRAEQDIELENNKQGMHQRIESYDFNNSNFSKDATSTDKRVETDILYLSNNNLDKIRLNFESQEAIPMKSNIVMYEETTINQRKNSSSANNYGQNVSRLESENSKLKDELNLKISELELLKETNNTYKQKMEFFAKKFVIIRYSFCQNQ